MSYEYTVCLSVCVYVTNLSRIFHRVLVRVAGSIGFWSADVALMYASPILMYTHNVIYYNICR